MSYQGCDFVRHWQLLVGHCPMTDCYLQPCIMEPHGYKSVFKMMMMMMMMMIMMIMVVVVVTMMMMMVKYSTITREK